MNTSLPSILRAVGFASLIQLVWLPVLLVDAIDQRNQASRLAEPADPAKPAQPAWAGRSRDPMELLLRNDDLLGLEPQHPAPQAPLAPTLANRTVAARAGKVSGSLPQPGQPGRSLVSSGADSQLRDELGVLRPLLPGGFTAAELLGGPLTLASLKEAPMPALARSERARWQASGDPLAPLSSEWREPMRQAMRQLATPGKDPSPQALVQQAQMVHVPSVRIRSSEQVPVAIHADGTVQVLRRPAAKEALRDIEDWSQRQALPEPGKVVAAVVSLEPLPTAQAPASSPAPAQAPPAAAATSPELVP
jgi:hypothetical protein